METKSDETHSHCDTCIQMYCNERVSCAMTWCELNCGVCFHACKRDDHANLCLNKWINCVNSGYGCPLTMPRWQIMNHIKRCPASVVHCTMEWNRRIHKSTNKFQIPEYSSREIHSSQLDLALAARDQHVLRRSRMNDPELLSSSPSTDTSSLARKLKNQCFYNVKCSHCEGRKKRFEMRHGESLHSHKDGTENGGYIACKKKLTNEECETDTAQDTGETKEKDIRNSKDFSTVSSMKEKLQTVEQATCVVEEDKLSVDLTLESMPRYQRKPSSMHTFLCKKDFRRDEINNHIQNVHSEIHAGLNGWLEPRCPLAQYGCTFSQLRFHPNNKETQVIYSQQLESFGLKPKPKDRRVFGNEDTHYKHFAITLKDRNERVLQQARNNLTGTDYISHLPLELLRHIVRMLDSFSISSLSLTSHVFRQVCYSLLEERGIVVPQWIKKNGTWEVKSMVWHFSTCFTGITTWKFEESHLISEHLKSCEYNHRLPITKQPVKVIITGSASRNAGVPLEPPS